MHIGTPQILGLYQQAARQVLAGERVSLLAHAWQCGRLAQKSGASDKLQLASWLHDIGHVWVLAHHPLEDADPVGHACLGGRLLEPLFGPAVSEPVRLHVLAKRYLFTTRGAQARKLSEQAQRSLALQGGPLSDEECEAFEKHPFFADAIQLRVWDDLGKKEGWFEATPQDALDQLDELIRAVHATSVTGCSRQRHFPDTADVHHGGIDDKELVP